MQRQERGSGRRVLRVIGGVVLAVLLLAAGCTAMLGSASHDAMGGERPPATSP